MLRLGEDSDEFRLSYRLHWLLDKGMFTTSERLEELGDKSMEIVHAWHKTPVVVGIDPARKQDSTIVTVVWVDWDHPDEFGFYEHRSSTGWTSPASAGRSSTRGHRGLPVQLPRLRHRGGRGRPGGPRHLPAPRADAARRDHGRGLRPVDPVEALEAPQGPAGSGKIGWPAHAKTRRLKVWKRFAQQMEDLELKFEGPTWSPRPPRPRRPRRLLAEVDSFYNLAIGRTSCRTVQTALDRHFPRPERKDLVGQGPTHPERP
jgi:hypothetical protein